MQQAPDPDAFRATLGRFATGVSVMTTTVDGDPHGMTASAVASLSLDPPLVLVCVERSAVMADKVRAAGVFALNFLAAGQVATSAWFADADRPVDGEQFRDTPCRTEATGSPVLDDTVGWVDCRVRDVHDGGDHLIVVGQVVALGTGPAEEPLLYYGSAYHRLGEPG